MTDQTTDERIAAAVADQTAALRQQVEDLKAERDELREAMNGELLPSEERLTHRNEVEGWMNRCQLAEQQLAERERQVGAMREALEEAHRLLDQRVNQLVELREGVAADNWQNVADKVKQALASPAPPLDGEQKKPVVEWWLDCGRYCLTVAGIVVAVEGDVCRDGYFDRVWTEEAIKEVAAKAAALAGDKGEVQK